MLLREVGRDIALVGEVEGEEVEVEVEEVEVEVGGADGEAEMEGGR